MLVDAVNAIGEKADLQVWMFYRGLRGVRGICIFLLDSGGGGW